MTFCFRQENRLCFVTVGFAIEFSKDIEIWPRGLVPLRYMFANSLDALFYKYLPLEVKISFFGYILCLPFWSPNIKKQKQFFWKRSRCNPCPSLLQKGEVDKLSAGLNWTWGRCSIALRSNQSYAIQFSSWS